MAWRTIYIENPARLSLQNNNLVIAQDVEVFFPLEDISALVLDSHGISFSQNLICKLGKLGITTIICDEKHLPNALVISYSQASRGVKNMRAQLNLPESTRKQLWRKNIMQKITNQADVLQKFGYDYQDLSTLSRSVRSGDVSNNESVAAKIYFSRLLDDSSRRQPTWHNSALNYGYAIIRSSIASAVASRGLIAGLGIKHHSELNQFNLADDLIESFRPLVDDYILSKVATSHIGEIDERLTKEDRHLIIDILNQSCIIIDKRNKIRQAIEIMVDSFTSSILEDQVELFVLPKIIK